MPVTKRRGSGKYRVHFIFTHANGRKEEVRKTTPFTNRRDAVEWERQLKQSMLKADMGIPVKKDVPTLRQYAKTFIDTYAKVENRPSEVKAKKSILKNHLLPSFGRKRLNEITKADIKQFRAKLQKMGLANSTINNQVTVLTKLLADAEENDLISYVPRVKRLKLPLQKPKFLTQEEAFSLIHAAEGEWRAMIHVAIGTGLRQGELLELQWRDIDFEKAVLVVSRSSIRGNVQAPKSNKDRAIPLNSETIDVLKAHHHNRAPYVFCDDWGKPFTDNRCKRPLARAQKTAGLKSFGWHVLRHTFASHLVQKGTHIMEVQKYLGHADIRMTLRYAYLNPEVSHDQVEMLTFYSPETAQNVIPFRKVSK